MPTPTTIGVDVGGTKLLALALDTTHDAVLGTARHPTPRGAEALLDGVAEIVAEITEQCTLGPDLRVGVGVAGLVDHRGVLRHGPNQHGVRELDVLGGLIDRLGRRVVVDNDGNCAVWAEWSSGAARGHDDVVLVTLGTGIGAGLMVGGQLVRGANGMAGEPGHTMVDPTGPPCPCGRRGCWERYASGAGLARMARDAAEAGRLEDVLTAAGGDAAAISSEDVVTAGRKGDPEAAAIMARFAWWTAVGVANLVAVLDPDVVVLGGGLIEAADLWLDETRRRLPEVLVASEHRVLPRVEAAVHGTAAAAMGAALLARDPA
ncbi:MAG TPA: ROK family protein [Acidimicrobiales bacterium]